MGNVPPVPDRLVDLIMANIPIPYPDVFRRSLHDRLEIQRAEIRQLLQVIWQNAYDLGMGSTQTRFMIVTAEEKERFLANTEIKEAADAD